jgi:hypothetical protein
VQALEEVRRRAFPAARYLALPATQVNTQVAFFTTLTKERLLEFGGEGIRKYDLIRWNLLATKIAEAKANLVAFGAGTGAYATLPQYLYEYTIGTEQLRYARSLYRPSPSTATTFSVTAGGVTYAAKRVNWRAGVNQSTADGLATFYVPNTGDELFPYSQSILDTSPGLVQNYGY